MKRAWPALFALLFAASTAASGLPRILYPHVACSDRPAGRRVVARIDEILDRMARWP